MKIRSIYRPSIYNDYHFYSVMHSGYVGNKFRMLFDKFIAEDIVSLNEGLVRPRRTFHLMYSVFQSMYRNDLKW